MTAPGTENAVYPNCGSVAIRGTRYAVSGTATTSERVYSGGGANIGSIDTPYDLGCSGQSPPSYVTSSWNSFDGQDTFVETDCTALICPGGTGAANHHLLTFKASCNTAGPWFDTVTQKCRGQ